MPPLLSQWQTDSIEVINDAVRGADDGEVNPFTLLTTAPTGTGKTLIAHHFIHTLLQTSPHSRIIYCTPLKALSNQKYLEMSLLFNSENVGLITGDTKINPDANILICTTEVVRNMWYAGDARDPPIGLILDEFHYIAAKGRGTAVEEAVTLAPKGTSFLLLSATIDDERILGWLEKVKRNVVKVSGRERVVGLEWMYWSGTKADNVYIDSDGGPGGLKEFSTYSAPSRSSRSSPSGGFSKSSPPLLSPNTINPSLKKSRQKKPSPPPIGMTIDRLKEMGMFPAIYFVFSRKGCSDMCDVARNWLMREKGGRRTDQEGRSFRGARVSKGVVDDVYYYNSSEDPKTSKNNPNNFNPTSSLLSLEEIAEVQTHITSYNLNNPRPLSPSQTLLLLLGLNIHHAGLLQPYRLFIESLFEKKLIKILYATTTLSAGINMPCKSVLVGSLTKRGDDGYEDVSRNLLLQMAGRAGRRGIDNKGYVVIVGNRFDKFEKLVSILKAKEDRCESCFEVKYGLVLCGVGRRRMREVVESSYYSYCKQLETTSPDERSLDSLDSIDITPQSSGVASIESLLSNAKKSDFIKTCIADEGIEVDYVILGKALKVYRGIKSRIRAEETTLKYLEEQESTGEDYVNIEMSGKRLKDLSEVLSNSEIYKLASQIPSTESINDNYRNYIVECLMCYYESESSKNPPPVKRKSQLKNRPSSNVNIPWSNFQALLRVLERHSCVVPSRDIKTTETENGETGQKVYTVTSKGDMVKKVNWDNR
ncbi:hypothetical protein TL16_g04357 [Triparma laevis f. inornata]|uniref:Uncharacterized protein n=1 Tax=Triparma laevis f. inornata TaxID=1714386 RepID=A0A9W7A5D7_9STRA|nr:hypothetical protein TL16_g04357 [Triparma laevis f. inornata]